MENRAYAIVAGLFAMLLVGAILASFWWLAGTHTPQAQYQIASSFPVSGLNSQAAVRFRGVTVGRVEDILLDPKHPSNILISISVDKTLQLTRGSFAQLAQQGLTGLAYIELDDSGKNTTPLGNATIPLQQSAMGELMASGKNIIAKTEKLEEQADKLLVTLNRLLSEENTQKINRLLTNMERTSADLQPLLQSSTAVSTKAGKLLDEIHPHELSATLEAVRQASQSARETAETARPTLIQVQKTLTEFERIGRHIEEVSAELGENLNHETLPRANELVYQLNRDAQSLNRLMQTLDEHPQSAIFGKPQPQPGPGEKGFQP
jgi:phospholipid/cholesterol/gamma-HCH transport system substrate-binding protein